MKKLLFLAIFSFLLFSYGQATVCTDTYNPIVNTCERIASSHISIEFEAEESLIGLGLVSSQQLLFTDGSGNTHTINVSVDASFTSGTTLDASFSTSSNLSGLTAQEGQQLQMVDVNGITITVEFIVVDQIMH